MYQLDVFMTQAVNSLTGAAALDMLMVWVSAAGVPLLVGLVAVQWWRRDHRQHVRHTLVAAGLSFLLGLGINQVVLLFVHRIRPYDIGVSHLLIALHALEPVVQYAACFVGHVLSHRYETGAVNDSLACGRFCQGNEIKYLLPCHSES